MRRWLISWVSLKKECFILCEFDVNSCGCSIVNYCDSCVCLMFNRMCNIAFFFFEKCMCIVI